MLEERQREYMELVGLNPLYRWLHVVLLIRADGVDRVVRDRLDTLVAKSGMRRRKVQDGLAALQTLGMVRRERHQSHGGPKGTAWTWTTTMQPYESWDALPLKRMVAGITVYLSTFHPQMDEERAAGASSSPKSAHQREEEHARIEGRARTATRHSPDTSSRHSSRESAAHFDDEDAGGDVARFIGTWVDVRQGYAFERFTDSLALRWLSDAARAALADGAAPEDIETAVADHAAQPFADPRDLAQWVSSARDRRLEAERMRRRIDELEVKREAEREAARLASEERGRELAPLLARAETLAVPFAGSAPSHALVVRAVQEALYVGVTVDTLQAALDTHRGNALGLLGTLRGLSAVPSSERAA